jgi:DNA-binding YbaB/EbfC family protein
MVNINELLKQAQNMQKQMQEAQEEIANKEYYGKSGGGLVSITLNGKNEMKKISIDPSLLKETEKEILEDLVLAAYSDVKNKADADSKNSMSDVFGNIPLPPGMKMPF